ncbi:MAG: hypothetical protein HFP77_08625 [Methylococcales symbiont of Iophon sp. n. MRB-2018]|nr:MAG: hypothetical protein HFP77_08625 [Methylococcales symbiont of Iophon sp. n. MRB-2018]
MPEDYNLKLITDLGGFRKASESFDGAVKSLDTSSPFEQAGEKIEKLRASEHAYFLLI